MPTDKNQNVDSAEVDPADVASLVNALIKEQPVATHRLRIRIVEVRDGLIVGTAPLEGNLNDQGSMYAGTLFGLGEALGAVVFAANFDRSSFTATVKDVQIRYRRPATTDVRAEASLGADAVERLKQEAETVGKAEFVLDAELTDTAVWWSPPPMGPTRSAGPQSAKATAITPGAVRSGYGNRGEGGAPPTAAAQSPRTFSLAPWTGSFSGCGIGTDRGIRGRCAHSYTHRGFGYVSYSLIIVAFEGSGRYIDAVVVTAVAMLVRVYLLVLPGSKELRLIERWAAGNKIDPMTALGATFTYARRLTARAVVTDVVGAALLGFVVGAIAGASGWRLVQYGIVGAAYGGAVGVISVHSFVEGALRPARAAIAGDTDIGDSLPRSRPTFAAWSNISMLAVAFAFATGGAMVASRARPCPRGSRRLRRDRVCVILVSGPLAVVSYSHRSCDRSATSPRNRTCRRRRLQPTAAGGSGR